MATLANKENNIFRMNQQPKTPGKSKSVMFKTPSRRMQDENAFNGLRTGKKMIDTGRVPGTVKTNQLPFTPVAPGRMILGGKTNVYKTPGLTNTMGKPFQQSVFKEEPAVKQLPQVEEAAPMSPEFDKYDLEIEFIPDPVEPLPFVPLDHIELNYEQLGKACRGRGQGINTDDSLDRPLSELIDELPPIDHLDDLDFLVTSPVRLKESPKVLKQTKNSHTKSRRLSARTSALRKKDAQFSQRRQKANSQVREPLQPSSRRAGYMALTISAAAKSKPTSTSLHSSAPRIPRQQSSSAMGLNTVPPSPSSDYDYENQADLSSLEKDIEELEKALLM